VAWSWITSRRAPSREVLPPPSAPRIFRPIQEGIEIVKDTIRKIGASNSLQAARDAMTQTEQRMTELEGERVQKLADAEGDYLAEIGAIDRQLKSLQADWIVHRDKIAALEIKKTKQHRAKREEEKTAFVAELRKTLPRRQTAVERLDAALKEVADAFAELTVADAAIFANWPEVLPPVHRLAYLSAFRIEPLSALRKQRPMSAGLIHELVKRVPFDFAAEVDKRSRELIEELEGSSIPAEEVAA
jgi:hypothetical protein